MPFRLPLIIVIAVVLNLLLFYMIHQMVTSDQTGLTTYEELNFVDFVRLQREEPEPERPPEEPPEELPPEDREEPPPEIPQPEVPQPEQMQIDMPTPSIDIPAGY
jgi:periplasmic protein TonB